MNGWRLSTWGEEVSLEYGKGLRGYESSDGPFRVFGSNGAVGWTDTALAKGPGVILGRKGAYRGVQYSRDDFYVIDTAYYVVPKTDLDMRWLYYAIQYHKLGEIDDGSPIPSTTRAAVYVRDFEVPPKETQVEVARILGALDDKIALNRQINQTLEQMAQALFKSWFVDFDPVRAKMAGRQLEGMDSETAALFPDELVASELGLVPKGWEVKSLGEMTSYLNRGISPKYVEEGGVLVLNQKCIRDNIVEPSKARRHDASQRKIDGKELYVGDILVNSTGVGTLGRVAQVLDLEEITIVDSHVTVIRPKYPISWCFLGIQLMRAQPDIEALGEGSTGQTELSRKKLAAMKFIVPSPALMDKFDTAVVPLRKMLSAKQKECVSLERVRDTLLPKLLSGELAIGDMV